MSAIRFGTDGIRDLAGQGALAPEACTAIGAALAAWARSRAPTKPAQLMAWRLWAQVELMKASMDAAADGPGLLWQAQRKQRAHCAHLAAQTSIQWCESAIRR